MNTKETERSLRQKLDDSEERYLRETLVMLQESYAQAAEPYIKRLIMITALRPPAPIVIPIEQAQVLGLVPPNVKLRGAPLLARPSRTQC